MTRHQQRLRRDAIAAWVASGKSKRSAAARFRVSLRAVFYACEKVGRPGKVKV